MCPRLQAQRQRHETDGDNQARCELLWQAGHDDSHATHHQQLANHL
jgi:hypothetical protein